MTSRKLFSIIAPIGLMIISAVSTHAQNNGAVELKKRIFAQIASGSRPQAAEISAVAEEATRIEPLAAGQIGILGAYPKKNALVGTWNVTLIFGDGTEVRSTLQIAPGAFDGEGSAVHASEFSLTPPNPTLPEQGSWQYLGGTRFIASYYGYSFDEQFAPFGKIGFRHAITMDGSQESFTGQAVFEVIDGTGQVLFSDNLRTRGVRHHAVAP